MRLLRLPQTAGNADDVAGAQLTRDIIIASPLDQQQQQPHQQQQQQHQHPYHNISAMHIVDVQQLKMAKSKAANKNNTPTTTTGCSNRRRKQHKTKTAQQLHDDGRELSQYNYNNKPQLQQEQEHHRSTTTTTTTTTGTATGLMVKSRSLERYTKPPHATLLAMEQEAAYTPTLNTSPRRRFLSPFKSLKRRSRSSSSSGGGSSRCDSRDVAVAAMLAIQREQDQPEQRSVEQFATAQTLLQQHAAKRSQHLHSTSSQSGDSGTGGTELEMELQDCSRTSAAASSQLSLSFSQLSSGADGDGEVDDDSSSDVVANVNTNVNVREEQQVAAQSLTCKRRSSTENQTVQHVANVVVQQTESPIILTEKLVVAYNDDNGDNDDMADETSNFGVTVDDLDASFAEESLYTIGNITLVDDTYSNYDPKNDAERMFLQVVGILRDENEVGFGI
ncbi:unnamed protein product [Ceratitis capitata]|uniref:(Mediterranean fruit fly) hypothetical protein n=1 Tax=Ceratitis capitata TaxID=7213 RepID=A0A811UA99_CERCA|nr:unnamed protein product [Ceratitis capitata]